MLHNPVVTNIKRLFFAEVGDFAIVFLSAELIIYISTSSTPIKRAYPILRITTYFLVKEDGLYP